MIDISQSSHSGIEIIFLAKNASFVATHNHPIVELKYFEGGVLSKPEDLTIIP